MKTTTTAKDIFSSENFEQSKTITTSRNSDNSTLLNSVVKKNNDVTKSALCDAVIMTAFQFADSVTLMQLKQLAEAASVRSDATAHVISHARDCFKQQHSKARAFMQKNFTLKDNVLSCNAETLALIRSDSNKQSINAICENLHAFIIANSKTKTAQTTSTRKRQTAKKAVNAESTAQTTRTRKRQTAKKAVNAETTSANDKAEKSND